MPDLPPRWPDGYRARPTTADDVPAVHGIVAAVELDLHGRVDSGPDGIAADLARPGLDPARDTLLVHDPAGAPAARAWVSAGRRAQVDVHPAHRGRGLGGALLDWVEARSLELGGERLAQTVSDGDRAAVAMLTARGYEPFVTSWLLEIALPAEPDVPEPPAGITVRRFAPGDGPAAHQVVEDAFDEWQQRRLSYREWARRTVERAAFAPAMSPLAFAGDELVGVVLSLDIPGSDEGYVECVAVRADQRHRGIARLLLRHAFRDAHRRGRRACTLWTHSETGALSLYERVGMTVRRSSQVYRRDFTA